MINGILPSMKRIIFHFLFLLFLFPLHCLANAEYPYPVSYFNFQSQNQSLKMAYMDVQPQHSNSKTVLLLHGKAFNGRYWENVIRLLSSNGYRVIAPEQLGFGRSSQPEHYQFSFQALAMNTHNLLESLHIDKVIVLGHSMGGMLATRFALMYPEQTTALVLENPIGLEDWKLYIPYHSVDEWYQLELKQTPESIKQSEINNHYATWRPEYERWVNVEPLKSPNYKNIAWNSALLIDMIFTQPVLYEFQNLQVPTLLIIGQLDRTAVGKNWAPSSIRDKLGNYPELGKKTAAKIPHAKLILIPNSSHIPHIEQPQAFYQALLPFLSGSSP
jgi:pimeloyl-ACP methyl ester carboxylesterase